MDTQDWSVGRNVQVCCVYFPSLRTEGAGPPMSSHRRYGSSDPHDSYMWYVYDRPCGEYGLHLLREKGFEGGSLALIRKGEWSSEAFWLCCWCHRLLTVGSRQWGSKRPGS